jgi:mRNA interferase RelE/StbE
MIYKIKYEKQAVKFMQKNKELGRKFYNAFLDIKEDVKENFLKYDIKKLKNVEDIYRMRIGKYRAIFKLIDEQLLILVLAIDSRGDIYKNKNLK